MFFKTFKNPQPIKCQHHALDLTVASDSTKEYVDAETTKVTHHLVCKCGFKVNYAYRTVTGKKAEVVALGMAQSEIQKIMEASKNG